MGTQSSLTWRTLGLAVIGLCLACARAAQGGPHPKARALSAAPAPATEGSTETPEWTGVGPAVIASAEDDDSGRRVSSRGTGATRVSRPGSAPGAVARTSDGQRAIPATKDDRERAEAQARRVEASVAQKPVAPVKAEKRARSQSGDPRVERALARANGGGVLTRNAFGDAHPVFAPK